MNIIRVVFGTVLVNAAGAGFFADGHRHPYDWSLALACLAAVAGVLILAWRYPDLRDHFSSASRSPTPTTAD